MVSQFQEIVSSIPGELLAAMASRTGAQRRSGKPGWRRTFGDLARRWRGRADQASGMTDLSPRPSVEPQEGERDTRPFRLDSDNPNAARVARRVKAGSSIIR